MGHSADTPTAAPSSGAAGQGTLFEALRTTTRSEHQHIESLLRLTEPMTLARYTAIVAGFHGFLQHWEPRVQAALPAHLHAWSEVRQRSPFAADDLRFFGLPVPQTQSPARADPVQGIPLGGLAHALGSMYVIEGSALGGQIITPTLARHLNLSPERGARYFHGFGAATGAMWREFRQRVDAEIGASAVAVEAACDGARATFRALIQQFRALPA